MNRQVLDALLTAGQWYVWLALGIPLVACLAYVAVNS